jgi:hypothetical protein
VNPPRKHENTKFSPRECRIGSARDGKVTAFIPDTKPDPDKNNNAGAEGIAADANGNVYVGDVTGMELRKHVRAK